MRPRVVASYVSKATTGTLVKQKGKPEFGAVQHHHTLGLTQVEMLKGPTPVDEHFQ